MKTTPMKSLLLVAAITVPALTGAAVASAQSPDTTYRPGKTMFAAKRANVRSGPGTRYGKVGILEIGQPATVTAKTGNWFKLAPRPEQAMRFVHAPLLTETRPATAGVRSTEPAGPGRTIHNGGSRYHGHTRNGRPHGQGVMTYASGNRYEGGFVNGRREGRGVFTWANGTRYEGEFAAGKRTGRGVLTWPNGVRHEGHWSDGDRHGEGWVILSDGTGYRGTWRNDKVGRRDYRRESWEPDRLRWLRESGFETQTASTERKPNARSSPREIGSNQASPDAKELWGVYVEAWHPAEEWHSKSYSIVWNASTPDDALRKALKLCQAKMGIPCWPPRILTSPAIAGGDLPMPLEVRFFSTSSDRKPLKRLVAHVESKFNYQVRCALVSYEPWDNTDPENHGYSFIPYWGNTPEEVRKEFEEDPNRKHHGGARIEVIACNDR